MFLLVNRSFAWNSTQEVPKPFGCWAKFTILTLWRPAAE